MFSQLTPHTFVLSYMRGIRLRRAILMVRTFILMATMTAFAGIIGKHQDLRGHVAYWLCFLCM